MEIVRGVLLDKNENCWKMGFTVLTNCLVQMLAPNMLCPFIVETVESSFQKFENMATLQLIECIELEV